MLNKQDQQIGSNLSACHRCPRRQQTCSGLCACLEDGRDIVIHAEAGDCPLGKHQPPASAGLGDTIAKIASATGIDKLAQKFQKVTGRDCGCKARQEKLNEWVKY